MKQIKTALIDFIGHLVAVEQAVNNNKTISKTYMYINTQISMVAA